MNDPWFALALGVLATWRVAHLLSHEDGPWDAMLRLRSALGNSVWGRLLDCFHCVSLWSPTSERPTLLVIAASMASRRPRWYRAELTSRPGRCLTPFSSANTNFTRTMSPRL